MASHAIIASFKPYCLDLYFETGLNYVQSHVLYQEGCSLYILWMDQLLKRTVPSMLFQIQFDQDDVSQEMFKLGIIDDKKSMLYSLQETSVSWFYLYLMILV
jgi:hypothetical protein